MFKGTSKNYVSYTMGTTFFAALVLGVVVACSGEQAKAKPNVVTKDAPRPGVVAKINGEEISEEALLGDEKLEFFEMQKRMYELKMAQLNKLMIEKLIGAEAKKANMSLDDFIQKNVVKKDLKVTDAEYKKFVADRKIPDSQINPQIKEKINAYIIGMKKQELVDEYVSKLTKSNPVEVYFTKPKMSAKIEAGDGPSFGGNDAKVTIVEFSDFQCPYCSKGAEVAQQLKKKYGNKIKFTFRHFPLPMHPDARPASEMSMCVHEQGADKFWKFHDFAFAQHYQLSADNLVKLAKISCAY